MAATAATTIATAITARITITFTTSTATTIISLLFVHMNYQGQPKSRTSACQDVQSVSSVEGFTSVRAPFRSHHGRRAFACGWCSTCCDYLLNAAQLAAAARLLHASPLPPIQRASHISSARPLTLGRPVGQPHLLAFVCNRPIASRAPPPPHR